MIKIEEKERCCGCSVCAQVCPQQCIKMTVDDEGFYYPKVNESQCVKCGICDKTCPILNNAANQRESPLAFAAYNLDEQERLQSSSGGLFSLIARATLQAGGVVFGASMADDCYTVNHIRVETERELHLLQGSKYLQSDVKTTFRQAKIDLETGRLVLYSGTPCQIGGLRTFLKKDYDNLLCVDVVCHGVPSPKLWKNISNIAKIARALPRGEHFSDIKVMAGKCSPYYLNFQIIRRTNKSFIRICLCRCSFRTSACVHRVIAVHIKD